MRYESFVPTEKLQGLVKEYWLYENEDTTNVKQKIIPDGYSEIIIHYGNPYRINLNGNWEKQSLMLFSSQISKFFFLENTGRSGMIGIKLQPAAFYELFQVDASNFTDHVANLENALTVDLSALSNIANKDISASERVALAESWLLSQLPNFQSQEKINQCIAAIFESRGMIEVDQLAANVLLSTRQLERLFKKVIGITPKFYCRIIRFNYIFEVIKEQQDSWIRTALQSGFFDQSHFIKNFKEFSGEEPSNYGFDEMNLANFFLKK